MSKTHTTKTGQELLAEMGRIPVIIPGKLSERRDTQGKQNGWKLQHWHNGRNQTRYVPAEQVQTVQLGTAGHQQFMALAEEYVELKADVALNDLSHPTHSKKKPMKP
jgi:hypothetical protein